MWEEWRDMFGCDGERIGCVWEEWRDMFGCDGDRIGFQIFPLMVES